MGGNRLGGQQGPDESRFVLSVKRRPKRESGGDGGEGVVHSRFPTPWITRGSARYRGAVSRYDGMEEMNERHKPSITDKAT